MFKPFPCKPDALKNELVRVLYGDISTTTTKEEGGGGGVEEGKGSRFSSSTETKTKTNHLVLM